MDQKISPHEAQAFAPKDSWHSHRDDQDFTRVRVARGGKVSVYMLPPTLTFEGLGRYFFDIVGFRVPKRGDYYVSGSEPEAFRAPNDLKGSERCIVKRRQKAKQKVIWVRA